MEQRFVDKLDALRKQLKEHKSRSAETEQTIIKWIHELTLQCDHVLPSGESAFTHWSCTICGKESNSAANR